MGVQKKCVLPSWEFESLRFYYRRRMSWSTELFALLNRAFSFVFLFLLLFFFSSFFFFMCREREGAYDIVVWAQSLAFVRSTQCQKLQRLRTEMLITCLTRQRTLKVPRQQDTNYDVVLTVFCINSTKVLKRFRSSALSELAFLEKATHIFSSFFFGGGGREGEREISETDKQSVRTTRVRSQNYN